MIKNETNLKKQLKTTSIQLHPKLTNDATGKPAFNALANPTCNANQKSQQIIYKCAH